MSKDAVKRSRHLGEVQGIHQQARVVDLPAGAGAHEAPELRLNRPFLLRGLLLKSAESSQLTLGVDGVFDAGGTEGADQLVLQICDTDVEAERFHVGATEAGAETSTLQTTPEVTLLSGVAQARQSDVVALRAEHSQEATDGLGTSKRHNERALSGKVATTAFSERFDRNLIADPFNQHHRTHVDANPSRMIRRG